MDNNTTGYLTDEHAREVFSEEGVGDGGDWCTNPAEAMERRTLYWFPVSWRVSLRPATCWGLVFYRVTNR